MAACRQATELASQLLTFSTGGEPRKRSQDLDDLVREVVGFALRGSSVRAEFDLPQGELWALVDRGQLTQVLHNLVVNAQQAMPRGGTLSVEGAVVKIGATWSEGGRPLDPGRYVRLAISDEGEGIGPEHLEHLFDPWFTTKEEGTGLGLAISHSVVVRHGGAITVDSVPGGGATFRIYLPAITAPKVIDEPDSGRNPAVPPLPGRRILVMDDEELVREVVGEMLSVLGHEVAFASDGAQAVGSYEEARAAGRPFDAVVMDLTIPGGMGGREAMRLLRDSDPQAVVIASSGYANDGLLANFQDEGFRAVLPKPYQVRDLAAVLSEVL
jgi:CheY-like chemotaxis protein